MKKFILFSLWMAAFSVRATGLDYHKEGSICDKISGFCAYEFGVSVALTKMYLGEKAEQKLMAEIRSVGAQDFDATTFTMRGGLNCDTKARTCWTDRYSKKVDKKATQTLFGK